MNPHSISTHRSSRWRQPRWWLLALTAALLPLFILGWALTWGSQPAKAAPAAQAGVPEWSIYAGTPDTVEAGEPIRYLIAVANTGTGPFTGTITVRTKSISLPEAVASNRAV